MYRKKLRINSLHLLLNGVRNFKYGSGYDETVQMGPLVSERQRQNVLSQVKDAVKKGARLITGGKTT